MYEDSTTVKLADFGMSKWDKDSYATMTKGLGTASYMAPEVIDSKPVKYKSDMYSLGVTLKQMLTLETPNMIDNIKGKRF